MHLLDCCPDLAVASADTAEEHCSYDVKKKVHLHNKRILEKAAANNIVHIQQTQITSMRLHDHVRQT